MIVVPAVGRVEWAQNVGRAITCASYALRVHDYAPGVSISLTWLEGGHAGPGALKFSLSEVLARVAEHGDLVGGLLDPAPF